MGFRDRMAKRRSHEGLQKRHNAGTKKTGGRFHTVFNKDKVPEGVNFWMCKEGEHLIDIIPFEAGANMPFDERLKPITTEGDLDYVLDLFVHMNIGKTRMPYVCPFENFGKACPICEFIKASRLDKEDWKKLVAKHRVIYQIWNHDTPEEEKKGIQIFEAAHFFMEEKIEEIAKSPVGGGYEDFSNPDTGKSLAWTRKGSGMENTQYLGHRFIERKPIPDRILDQTFPLDGIVNMHPNYDKMKAGLDETLISMGLKAEDKPPTPEDTYAGDIPDDHVGSSLDKSKKKSKSTPKRDSKNRKRPTSRKRKRTSKRRG